MFWVVMRCLCLLIVGEDPKEIENMCQMAWRSVNEGSEVGIWAADLRISRNGAKESGWLPRLHQRLPALNEKERGVNSK